MEKQMANAKCVNKDAQIVKIYKKMDALNVKKPIIFIEENAIVVQPIVKFVLIQIHVQLIMKDMEKIQLKVEAVNQQNKSLISKKLNLNKKKLIYEKIN